MIEERAPRARAAVQRTPCVPGALRRACALPALPALLAALVLAGCGGSSPLPGTYTTNIHSPRKFFQGVWTLTLGKGGSFTIGAGREVEFTRAPGSYYTSSRLVIVAPTGQCGPGVSTTGTYKLEHNGSTVKLSLISDRCPLRPTVLSRSFTRVH